ncbi:DUF2790 domain-containing protein [Pseudomonas sp. NPDC007930]|uniref:DUF2790 domain-containing protein n=1 Tax=Pseudomonas sp. NPDC007930 TaxID=3364417 RepID=UPI0036E3946B
MKTAFAIAALTAVFATGAYAADGASRSLANIPTEQYHYGMNLDVQRIISKTDVSNKTGTVPVTMVYEDSHGQVHKLQYLETGGFDNDNS